MNRRQFLGAAAAAGSTTMLKPAREVAGVGLTVDQYVRLPQSHKALVDEWVTANGVKLKECTAIRLTGDGAAHFRLYTTDARGKFVLEGDEIADYWLCVRHPTRVPDVAWLPWGA